MLFTIRLVLACKTRALTCEMYFNNISSLQIHINKNILPLIEQDIFIFSFSKN